MLKKALAMILSLIMAVSVNALTTFAQDTEESVSEYYKGVFYFRPSTGEFGQESDIADVYTYSDDYFRAPSKNYNAHLSAVSMALAEASVSSSREPDTEAGYVNKSRNVTAFLEDIGFSDIEINDFYRQKPTKDSIGALCSHKRLTSHSQDYTLVTMIPRSAGYEAEWGNNFILGTTGDAEGFDRSSDECLRFMRSYIAEHHITGQLKVWITGYSRGAAVADLTAKKLIDSPKTFLGDTAALDSEDLYVYTFGTPSAADKNANTKNKRYAGIFNQFSDMDIVSKLAPADMGFTHYGTDYVITDDTKLNRMLELLAVCNPSVRDTYVSFGGSSNFKPKKLSFADGSVAFADDDDSYIPSSGKEYLDGLCTYLTLVAGGREHYVETFEQPFSEVISYFGALSSDELEAFMSSVSSNDDTYYLIAAMYAYFMRLKETDIASSSENIRKKAEELVALASGEEAAVSGVGASVIAKVSAALMIYLMLKPERLKEIAADYLGSVLERAMKAAGADQTQIDSLTEKETLLSTVHLLSHLLLGNIWQSEEIHPLQPGNEQIKSAATLIGNFTNVSIDHYNEPLVSWLRVDDSYYDDYASLTDAQLYCYRRLYLNTSEPSLINGVIRTADGSTAALIKDGRLSEVADRWVGFTETDEGGFFRIPSDQDYTFILAPLHSCDLTAVIKEYNVDDASLSICLEKTVEAQQDKCVNIFLPAIQRGEENPSSAGYRVTVEEKMFGLLGDADEDGEISILDATAIQKSLASLIQLSKVGQLLADADQDETVTVLDATAVQKFLAFIPTSDGIGEPIRYSV